MHAKIKTALEQLDQANINGFFQHLSDAVPSEHRNQFNALRQEFISGRYPWDFPGRLKDFANMLAQLPSTPASAAPAVSGTPNRPLRVFISFAPDESNREKYSRAIKQHLNLLTQQGAIEVWDREDLRFGEMVPQLERELAQADVFVALMSSNYFSNDSINKVDLRIAKQRNAELVIVPVILRALNWEDTWLGKFPPLPRDQSPIKSPENDEAWVELDTLLRHILDKGKASLLPIVEPLAHDPPAPPVTPPTPPPTTTTPTPMTIVPPPPSKTTWEKFVQFWQDVPTIIKGISVLAAALLGLWTYFSPKPSAPKKVTIKGELISAATSRPLDNLEVWVKDHRDLKCLLRTGENTFAIHPVDPKMDNGLISLVVDFKGAQYTDELVSTTLINLSNYNIEGEVLNIGEVTIPEPLKPSPTSVTPPLPKGKGAKALVLTGNLNVAYPGKTISDVRRVFLTDYPTNDDTNVATSGQFKIPCEKPVSDGLYKISVVFKDGTLSQPILKKQLEKPGPNGELSLGTLTVER